MQNEITLPNPMCDELVIDLCDADSAPFEAAVAEHDQFRYIINLDERGDFSASLYPILPNGSDGGSVLDIINAEQASFLDYEGVDIRNPQSVVDHQVALDQLPPDSTGIGASADPKMVDPTDCPYWDFLEVNSGQADKLRRHGEVVTAHPGFNGSGTGKCLIWCRDSRIPLDKVLGSLAGEAVISRLSR